MLLEQQKNAPVSRLHDRLKSKRDLRKSNRRPFILLALRQHSSRISVARAITRYINA